MMNQNRSQMQEWLSKIHESTYFRARTTEDTDDTEHGVPTAIEESPTHAFSTTQIESQHSDSYKPEEWISHWLRVPTLCCATFLTIGIMGALIALIILSKQNHGIASANLRLEVLISLIPDFNIGVGLSWTTLPVLLFQIYGLAIGATIKAASARQPYIELRGPRKNREGGAAAEKSILLDYQSYWAVVAPFKALWFNHYMLAYSFTVLLLLTLILGPLAAHLFFATTIEFPAHLQVQQSSKFSTNGFGHDSLQPSMDISASTLIYGARPIAWTTQTEAFLPFMIPHNDDSNVHARNLSVSTSALKATLDCEILGSSEFELQELQNGGWYFSWSDRGCSAASTEYTPQLISGASPFFVQTYTKQDCSVESGSLRVLVIAASDPDGSREFTNSTAISCIPHYSQVRGLLNLNVGAGISPMDDPKIVAFTPQSSSEVSAGEDSIFNFNLQLMTGRYYDSSSALTANEYGELIYAYVQKSNPHELFTGAALKAATEATYASVFAIMASQYLVEPSTTESILGILYDDDTRIVVVLPVACTILAILLATTVMLVWIWVYTKTHDSILYESPTALLGAAVVLRNSTLMKSVKAIDGDGWCGKMGMAFIREQRSEEEKAHAKGWRFENWEHPQVASINSTTQVRPFGLEWVKSLRRLISRR